MLASSCAVSSVGLLMIRQFGVEETVLVLDDAILILFDER
jgi:hypothetical protein